MRDARAMEQLQGLRAGSGAFGLQPISSNAIEAGRRRSGNPLGLEALSQTWFHMDVAWWWPSDDQKALASHTIINEIEDAASARELPALPVHERCKYPTGYHWTLRGGERQEAEEGTGGV
ncbi:hypothetical protein DL766_006057 [Monosporascus sp. MC13-8B]|uniref:Uncharacterized protein n=1 Tax=Monosporascus cannonballus TaxID=155416 RepID=A0ABY0GUC4_9PEZI|nr:hypothetical protein DL762_009091 [Monosporascus cannonballus]RYP28161.1 hypothetical protein DL766_006057 [Monosporascus sp. MC13-8B]